MNGYVIAAYLKETAKELSMSNWIPIIAICVIVLFFSFIMLYATLYPHFQ